MNKNELTKYAEGTALSIRYADARGVEIDLYDTKLIGILQDSVYLLKDDNVLLIPLQSVISVGEFFDSADIVKIVGMQGNDLGGDFFNDVFKRHIAEVFLEYVEMSGLQGKDFVSVESVGMCGELVVKVQGMPSEKCEVIRRMYKSNIHKVMPRLYQCLHILSRSVAVFGISYSKSKMKLLSLVVKSH